MKQSESKDSTKNNNSAKIAVLGLGGAGVKICTELLKTGFEVDIAVLDFDDKSLASFPNSNIITPKNFSPRYSFGTGGDVIIGERLTSLCRQKISEFLNGHEVLIAVAGMGGGTGSAAAPIVAREAKKSGIQTVFLVTLPFSFEGQKRRILAEKSIENLIIDADIVIPIANDILFSSIPADSPFAESFLKADVEMAKATKELSNLFASENYISSALPNLKNIISRKKTTCIIGYGEIEIEDNNDFSIKAVEQLFDSPLLGKVLEVNKADAALIVITAGEKIGIGQIKRTFERVKIQFKDDAELVCVLSRSSDEKIFKVTLIGIRYEKTSTSMPVQKNLYPEKKRNIYTQDELPLFTPRKGIFTNSSDNFYKNQDLDIPVFQRKGISIDPGQ